VGLSHDNQTVVAGSKGGIIYVWNTNVGSTATEIKAHDKAINSLACSPDGRQVASASQDGTICIWDVATRSAILALKPGAAYSLTWSLDGSHIAGAGTDGVISVWNAKTGLLECQRKEPSVRIIKFLANNWLESFTDKDAEKIWDWKTDKIVMDFNFGALGFGWGHDIPNFGGNHHTLDRRGSNVCLVAKRFGYQTAQDFGPAIKVAFSDLSHLVASYPDDRVILWTKIYPETWWGMIYLPEVWIALIFGGALVFSIFRDSQWRSKVDRTDA